LDSNPTRETKTDDADGMILAFELVLTPTIMGLLGYMLDRWAGTTPVFTVFLAGFTLAYTVWKVVRGYNARMALDIAERDRLSGGGNHA
jgi:F0F1-type ATP synthase assembly protein I